MGLKGCKWSSLNRGTIWFDWLRGWWWWFLGDNLISLADERLSSPFVRCVWSGEPESALICILQAPRRWVLAAACPRLVGLTTFLIMSFRQRGLGDVHDAHVSREQRSNLHSPFVNFIFWSLLAFGNQPKNNPSTGRKSQRQKKILALFSSPTNRVNLSISFNCNL